MNDLVLAGLRRCASRRFEALCCEGGVLSRGEARAWLSQELSQENPCIDELDALQCRQIIRAMEQRRYMEARV